MKNEERLVETLLAVVKNLGTHLIVEFVTEAYNRKGKYLGIVESGLKVIPNPRHRCYNEMWEWDRIDREIWDQDQGEHLEKIRIAHLPKKKETIRR